MKTTITHTCGHQQEIVIFGKKADREKKIAWLESQPCAECRAAESAEISKATGMAALTGSPRQIAWAEDLRGETMTAIDALKTRTDDEAALKARVVEYLGGIASAAWWIDNHIFAGTGMIRRAVEHAAENGIDLTAAPEEPVEEPVEAVETAETVKTADRTESVADSHLLTVKEFFGLDIEPPTKEEKEQAEFEQDVSTYVALYETLDECADDHIEQFRRDLVKTKGEDYWDKVVAAGQDRREKMIAEVTMRELAKLKKQTGRTTVSERLALHEKWVYTEVGGERLEEHGTDLSGADLSNAFLCKSDLTYADLTNVNLTGADLYKADLTGADLTGANLHGADLTYADLTNANLHGADLTGANLHGADLTGANLHGADLTGADLSDADLC